MKNFFWVWVLCGFVASIFSIPAFAGEDWLPISADELKMTSEPKAPGAPAIYLYRQEDHDDVNFRQYTYNRIKIFNEEGRKYSNVEIAYVKGSGDIHGLQARTIRPDGTVVNFDGKVYEKTVVKAKGVKILAKTFAMPDVQPGSIIEYRFTRSNSTGYVFDSRWLLSEELFTRHARFSFQRNTRFAVQWSWPRGLPEGTRPPAEDHHVVRLETYNVPAFQIEDYMPPPDEMKYRVDFTYISDYEKDPERFWKREGQRYFLGVGNFTNKHKAMEAALLQIIAPEDSPQLKLQKIYARCQSVRNTSLELDKDQQERDREKLKDTRDVEDVWKHGYGDGYQITWLFLALARAAGFDASPVLISTRDKYFFERTMMNAYDLTTNVVLVKLNGKDLYLDPGIAHAPFGLLPWHETGVAGLRLDKDGGTWITTTMPGPDDSGMERKATLHLSESGSLEGNVTVTFKGLSALSLRRDEEHEDVAQHKKVLEDQLKEYIPVSIDAELINAPDWTSSAPSLVAEYSVKVPDWASSAGRHTVLAAGLFGGSEKHVFEHAVRVHPIYFDFPYSDVDDVTIVPPPGQQFTALPSPQHLDRKLCTYDLVAETKTSSLHVTRHLMVNVTLLHPQYYESLRSFFQTVRTDDELQAVLSPSAPSSPH